ncbi:MAG: MCE family protein [Streptosporangiaceae bacterium]
MKKLILSLTLVLATTGCILPGVQDMPLPGGADVGDHPYTVRAQFVNVASLVTQSAVKVNDVPVGRVTKVTVPVDGWTADVTMLINGDVKLPADALAKVQQSSLLGEKYVQLAAPKGGGTGVLATGSVIPVTHTNRNTEVEEVFGALSLLLNGGGIDQIQTITRELNKALGGNEPAIRSMLKQVNTLTSSLDANKEGIVEALDGLNRLSGTLASHKEQIAVALDDLAPGLKVLESQRGALVRMLDSLRRLSTIAVDTIRRSKTDLVADLRALEPTLRKLADSGRDLPQALQVLITYPFPDSVLPAIKGDYLNSYISVTAPAGTTVIPPLKPEGK